MQVGNYRRQQTVGAALLAAAQGNPYGAARTAYQIGKSIYKAMPSKRKSAPKANRSRKRTKKTSKAPGGAGSLRQRKPYSRRVSFRKARKCRTMGRRKLSRKVCHLEKRVQNLTFAENASLGTFTHRKIRPGGYSHGTGATNYGITTGGDGKTYGVSLVEGLVMDDFNDSVQYLKYYNPATPGTLTVADGKTGTYDRRYLFKSVYASIECRNNYQIDCKLKVYLLTPKQSSSVNPVTAWANGITANGDASITSYLQIGQYPNDYSDFKDVWKAKLHCKATLAPGQTMTCSHGVKNIEYDPAAYAQHTAAFQSKYKNFLFLIVVEGTVGHETATVTTGLARAGVDARVNVTRVVQYDAGVNISFQKVENGLQDATGAVQSHQPIPDNITFSST